jgi:transcriptional regulator with XRE-family HTH domain
MLLYLKQNNKTFIFICIKKLEKFILKWGDNKMSYENEMLYQKEDKLTYIIKFLNLKSKEVAKKLEISPAMMAKLMNPTYGVLKMLHVYAFCKAYNVPLVIFEDKHINTTDRVENILTQEQEVSSIFYPNNEILDEIVGDWYMYSYPSTLWSAEVWETKTTVFEDGMVVDQHNNNGKLYIGKNQSIILKESRNSKNITSITFDNNQITYKVFPFSRVSKSNSLNQPLFNFGFFSKEKVLIEDAKGILGDLNEVQLEMNFNLMKRVHGYIQVGK